MPHPDFWKYRPGDRVVYVGIDTSKSAVTRFGTIMERRIFKLNSQFPMYVVRFDGDGGPGVHHEVLEPALRTPFSQQIVDAFKEQ